MRLSPISTVNIMYSCMNVTDFISNTLVRVYYAVADLHSKILDARPPGGPNSFNFMQFLGKFGKIVCWRPPESWRPLLGEILDPPLL